MCFVYMRMVWLSFLMKLRVCNVETLEAFSHSSGLTINVDKLKMMVVRTIQPHPIPYDYITEKTCTICTKL